MNHTPARNKIAVSSKFGRGVAKDDVQELEWYEKAFKNVYKKAKMRIEE